MANILAVDDNPELCRLICMALERDGHRVETRNAGKDLTEALCRWADCILLDVMMPEEDGFAVCRRIRGMTEAPILFLSARTDEPAVQTVHVVLGVFLLLGVVGWSTHRTGKFLAREAEKLTEAAQNVAQQNLEETGFGHARVKEYDAALQALQTMGGELTDSLQRQWDMEQRQREQIMQLSHKLKTPLTLIQGNAELLAEDENLTPEQKRQLEIILRNTEQTREYLLRIRAEVQTPLKYNQKP